MPAFKTDMMDLARLQVDLLLSNNVAYCEILVTCYCPREILNRAYRILVRMGKITALEDMPYEDQKAAGQLGKDIAKGRLQRKELIEVVKALLAVEYFLNL